jgi:hypothetical protein
MQVHISSRVLIGGATMHAATATAIATDITAAVAVAAREE